MYKRVGEDLESEPEVSEKEEEFDAWAFWATFINREREELEIIRRRLGV